MRGLFFDRTLFYVPDHPIPEPKEDEALIRVTHAGICSTDLEIIKGYMDFKGIPGHEFAGIVVECNDMKLIGKRVVGEINIGCGGCDYCLKGMKIHCPHRSVLGIHRKDGVFAEYTTLPVENLYEVPGCIRDEEAVFIEPLAAAFEIIEQVDIRQNDRICILGDGRLGLLAGQVLSLTGCSLTVIGKHREKLKILEDRGIKTSLRPVTTNDGFDLVVDTTGSYDGLKDALKMVRPRGRVVMKTTVAKKRGLDLNQLVIDEITLIGSRCGPFPKAIDALKRGDISVIPLISNIFPLEDGIEAFRRASQKDVLKVIIKIE